MNGIMNIYKFTRVKRIPILWTIGIIISYSLLLSEYHTSLSSKVLELKASQIIYSSVYLHYVKFNYVFVFLSGVFTWIISSFLFHIFSILLGGTGEIKSFIKYSGLLYIFPLIGFAICLVLFQSVKFSNTDIEYFFSTDSSMIAITWIINVSSSLCILLLIPIVKMHYKLNWLKAIGAIFIPLGSIYFLGLFFSKYVL